MELQTLFVVLLDRPSMPRSCNVCLGILLANYLVFHVSSRSTSTNNIMSESRKALVTGATGLLGRAVASAFESAKWSVQGTGFTRASPPKTLKVDLTDAAEVEKAIDDVK